ncbi:MAG TPA: translocation/assembly module TamB domain-containing protein [Burkholderiales bacterium]|nr:translocation/assembly module TamB domain-containing protein [Burkholderiales bacterium]
MLRWFLRGLVFIVLLAAGGAVWLLGTESGLRWALGFAPADLELETPRGTLIGTISFERVAFQGSEARKVSFDLNLLALLADTISVEFLRVESLTLKKPSMTTSEASAPFPFRIRVADAQVKSVVFEGYEIHDLSAEYSGSASGHELQAAFSGAGARARLKGVLGGAISLEGQIQGLNLAVIDPAAPQTALDIVFQGKGDAKAFAGKLSASNPQPGPIDRERLPFARVDASFSTNLKSIAFDSMRATLHPAGSIAGKGSASLERATLELRIADLDLRSVYSSLRATRLSGNLDLELAAGRQRVKGTLAQEDMSLAADAERRGDDVEIRALHARAGESEASGSGRVHLGEPLRFAADLKLARFDPARFGDYPQGSLNGTLKASGDLGGRGAASWQIAGSRLFGEAFASAGSAELVGERIARADAWATLGANRATAKGSFGGPRDELAWTAHIPELARLAEGFAGEIRARGSARGSWKEPMASVRAEAFRLRLTQALTFDRAAVNASGTLGRHEGEITARNADLDLGAKLRGGWRNDAWRGEIVSLENAGAYPFALKTPAALEAGPKRVALGKFQAELAGARASVESVRWESRRLTSSGRIAGLAAQWIAALLDVDKVAGDLALDAEWDLAATPRLNGQVTVRRASGDLAFGDTALGLSQAQLQARFKDDSVEVKAGVASRLGSAKAEGTVAGLTRASALRLTAEVEAAELRSLTEPLLTQARVSGRVTASLKVAGTVAAPELSGALRGDALGVEMPPWGVAYHDGRVRADLDANRLVVTEARIAAGDGELTASGTLALGGEAATTLSWEAKQFRALGRPDRRLVASGKGVASFDGRRFGLKGELRADHGHFEIAADSLPQLDDDVEVLGAPPGEVRLAARKQGPLPLDLDLRLDLGSRLTLRAHGFNGGVSGQVRVYTGAAGELLAQGRVEAVKATFYAYGQELEVDPGALLFDGPIGNPALEITAWRRRQQVEAGLRLTGTVQAPRVQLVSNPAVSENEKLSWLVLGRAPADVAGADLALLQAAGGAVFYRGGEQPLHRRFAASLGFDELTVRGSSELTGNVVALGKRYSEDIYISFEQAISTTTEYLVKLDYALTQRISLRGQTGTTSGVGLFYRYSWD